MRPARRLAPPLTLALVLALIGCGNSGGSTTDDSATTDPSSPATEPSATVGEPAATEPTVSVTPVADDAHAVSAEIGYDGGELTATGADGTVYTLVIPPDAVRWPATITMTPLSAIDGLLWGDGESYAVQLEPSGLVFDQYARLTIEPPVALPSDEQILFGYQGQGSDLALAMPDLAAGDITILLTHFSGYGVKKGYLGDVEAARKQLGGTAEQQITNEVVAALQAEKARMEADDSLSSGPMSNELREQLARLDERFKNEVLDVRIAAAGTSCAAARLAADTILDFQRQLALSGQEGDTSGTMAQVLELLRPCVEEEYDICAEQHIVHRMYFVWVDIQRQSDLNGGVGASVAELARQRMEDCVRFELEFNSDGHIDSPDGDITSAVTATVLFEYQATMPPDFVYVAKPLRNIAYNMTVSDAGGGGCTLTNTPGDGVFEPQALSWKVDWGETPDKKPGGFSTTMGKVTEITLVWKPQPTQESSTLSCPGLSVPIFQGQVWSAMVWGVGHYEEAKATPERGFGYWIEGWNLLGGAIWAQKEYVKSFPGDGGITVDEQTLFILRHVPKKSG